MHIIKTPLAACVGAILAVAALPASAQAISAADFAKRSEAWGATLLRIANQLHTVFTGADQRRQSN